MLSRISLMVLAGGVVASVEMATAQQPDVGSLALSENRIQDATQMEYSPEYTDLYLIETFDKSRSIHIYCNASSCYKLRGVFKFV